MAADSAQVDMDGHRFGLTNLSKVLYPATGTTKADVIGYFAEIAPLIIPLVRDRPVTRTRWPDGVQAKPFFHKNIDRGTPAWVPRAEITHKDRTITYPLIDSPATLAWLGQNAALELHVPQWQFAKERSDTGRSETARIGPDPDSGPLPADRAVFDLDPGPGVGLAECAVVARLLRERLSDQEMTAFPVTSGSKGLHLYVPFGVPRDSDEVSEWAKGLAEAIEKSIPKLVTSRMSKALRPGKVFIDWSQNNAAKTTIAPYSLRGRETPTVAAPRTWAELDDPDLRHLDYREVLDRVRSGLRPEAGLATGTADPSGQQDSPPAPDKLATYRSKRSADRTPEPIPKPTTDDNLPQGSDDTFVIQEHHATALHWDFRLERSGVLVSWAVPKGIPTSTSHNRLAVQTEDHPLEYASFAGTIGQGEYGGGEVTIWDSGHYTCEKWRDDEVIVTLSGERATGRFALIRTKGRRGLQGGENQWLMHRTKNQPDLPEVTPRPGGKFGADRRIQRPGAPRAKPAEATDRPLVGPATDPPARQAAPHLEPMLATAGTLADVAHGTWRFEGKWDGVRALVELNAGRYRLVSRNGNEMTDLYPELAEVQHLMDGHIAVLDAEIVAFDGQGVSDFSLLQRRMKLTKAAEIERTANTVPVELLVFDVLYLDGISLLAKTYDDRRRVLEALPLDGRSIRVPPQLAGPASEALVRSRDDRWEGVVAKRADSPYLPGKRGGQWIKLKNQSVQEVVVVGWRPGAGRRAGGIGSLLLALPAGGGFEYVGKVGTGFTDAELDDLRRLLEPLNQKPSPVTSLMPRAETVDARWVRPELVGEVIFANWTGDGRLRQASWRGLRTDKKVEDIERA